MFNLNKYKVDIIFIPLYINNFIGSEVSNLNIGIRMSPPSTCEGNDYVILYNIVDLKKKKNYLDRPELIT